MKPHRKKHPCSCPRSCAPLHQWILCVFCSYPSLPTHAIAHAVYEGPCARCHNHTMAKVSYHPQCLRTLAFRLPPSTNNYLATMYRLSVCIKPRYQSYVALDEIQLLDACLESIHESIKDQTELFQVRNKLPKEVQMLVFNYLAPFPEAVALAQTRTLLRQLHLLEAPCDSITFIKANARLYLSTITYQGREYISRISNRRPHKSLKHREVELAGDHTLITMDHFGVRDISSSSRKDDRGLYFSSMGTILDHENHGLLIGETDGLFLRTLHQLRPQISDWQTREEWNTPSPPNMDLFCKLRSSSKTAHGSVRLDYHSLENLEGVSACSRQGRTVGLFIHKTGQQEYGLFIKRLTTIFGEESLVFHYFPFSVGETLQEVGMRKIAGSGGPASFPVIQLVTRQGRSYAFGPHIEPEAQALFELNIVRLDEGHLSGLYHTAIDNATISIDEVGILRENALVTEISGLKIPTNDWHGPALGAPSRDWYLNIAALEGVTSVRLCEANLGDQQQCTGLLLTYEDGHQESLGQFRFDKYLSRELAVDAVEFNVHYMEMKPCVRWRFRASGLCTDSWCQFPGQGTVCWWFGPRGDFLVSTV